MYDSVRKAHNFASPAMVMSAGARTRSDEVKAELPAGQIPRSTLPSNAQMGVAQLRVRDLDKALIVWRDLVGLSPLRQSPTMVELGAGERTVVILRGGATSPAPRPGLGLFHIAVRVPTRLDLARATARLHCAGWGYSSADHLVSQSVYLTDFDGNGIELMFDTKERGHIEVVGGQFRGVLADGSPHPVNGMLDARNLFVELPNDDSLKAPLPAGTCVGHVHLSVDDLDRTMAFYADVIGLTANRKAKAAGMYDTALGTNSHAIAFNVWASRHGRPPGSGDAGLDYFTVEVPSVGVLNEAAARLGAAGVEVILHGASLVTKDPCGNAFHLVAVDRGTGVAFTET